MQGRHLADDDQARRFETARGNQAGNVCQRAARDPLPRRGALLDHRGRHIERLAVRNQLSADFRQRLKSHIDHHRLARLRQGFPIQIQRAVLQVASGEDA